MKEQNKAQVPATVTMLQDLASVLGFDPTKETRASGDTFADVVKELNEEQQKVAKERAKNLLVQAINEAKEFAKIQKQYQEAEKKHLKAHAKTLNRIKALANGQAEPTDEEKEE